jgi:outer membrane receptor protein involved in Fe transport
MLPIKPLSAAIALLLATSVAAQTTPAEDDTETLDTVTVTGTNLRGVDLAEAQPITILDAEDIRRIGATSVSDVLRQVSELGGGTGNFTTANSGVLQADAPAGSAGASLRGLGTASTLTLVNGRRVAVASFANGSENFVDLNAIPVAAIERIEVLAAGASAVYGADAVAGVVNIVLRNRFDGLRLSASHGDSTRSTDEARSNLNLVAGFGDDDAGGVVVVDAFRRAAFYNRDRAITAREPRPSQQGFFPSWSDGGDEIVEAQCPRSDFGLGGFGEFCAVNRNAFTAADPSLEQFGTYLSYGLRFEDVEVFGEVQYQRNRSEANSAPAPWDAEASFANPSLPADFRARYLSLGFDPAGLYGFGRFPDARTIEVETTNLRVLLGLRGSLGDWGWETAFNGGSSRSEQAATAGIYNVARFQAALLGELCIDGRTTCAPGAGGLWYNPFGGQAVQDARVLGLIRESVPREGHSQALGWDLRFNGELGELGGGAIAAAFGTEVRNERTDDEPSPLATADPITGEVPVYGFGSTAVSASRTASSAFAEVLLPFTATFDVRLAGRYDHYSDFDGDFNPSIGLRFRPTDDIVLRAGWNTSYRAPSLAQVGAGTTLSSGAIPCAAGSEFRTNFCRGSSRDVNYLSQVFGNPDLEAETSTAWSAGLVWSPGDATSVSLDYWNFEQENLVDIADLDLFRAALANPALIYTPSGPGARPPGAIGIVTRDGTATGRIVEVFLELSNIGVQRTDGLDIDLRQRLAEDFAGGELRAWADATYVNSFERSELCSAAVAPRRGQGACINGTRVVELVGEFRYPEWLGNVGLTWENDAVQASLWANYVDSYFDDDTRSGVAANRRVGSFTTLSASLGWDITDTHYVSLAVRNLTDRDPPLALGSSTNVDTFNHDALGRFITVNWIGRF